MYTFRTLKQAAVEHFLYSWGRGFEQKYSPVRNPGTWKKRMGGNTVDHDMNAILPLQIAQKTCVVETLYKHMLCQLFRENCGCGSAAEAPGEHPS